MNPTSLKLIAAAFSMKPEIKLVFYTVGAIFLVPMLIVMILTQAGFNLISDALATSDPQTQVVEIHNPANGETIDHIDAPRVWPANGVVTLEFGEPNLPYYLFHTGIDIADPHGQIGSPVVAFMKGKIRYADTGGDLGTHVVIEHNSYLTSTYGHLSALAVTAGDDIEMGEPIGLMGSTGQSSGPHLHFEIRIFYIPVNARIFLTGDPVL
ncbi:MAG: M23 family metallopeptidase [Patescibacteria group bacterium]